MKISKREESLDFMRFLHWHSMRTCIFTISILLIGFTGIAEAVPPPPVPPPGAQSTDASGSSDTTVKPSPESKEPAVESKEDPVVEYCKSRPSDPDCNKKPPCGTVTYALPNGTSGTCNKPSDGTCIPKTTNVCQAYQMKNPAQTPSAPAPSKPANTWFDLANAAKSKVSDFFKLSPVNPTDSYGFTNNPLVDTNTFQASPLDPQTATAKINYLSPENFIYNNKAPSQSPLKMISDLGDVSSLKFDAAGTRQYIGADPISGTGYLFKPPQTFSGAPTIVRTVPVGSDYYEPGSPGIDSSAGSGQGFVEWMKEKYATAKNTATNWWNGTPEEPTEKSAEAPQFESPEGNLSRAVSDELNKPKILPDTNVAANEISKDDLDFAQKTLEEVAAGKDVFPGQIQSARRIAEQNLRVAEAAHQEKLDGSITGRIAERVGLGNMWDPEYSKAVALHSNLQKAEQNALLSSDVVELTPGSHSRPPGKPSLPGAEADAVTFGSSRGFVCEFITSCSAQADTIASGENNESSISDSNLPKPVKTTEGEVSYYTPGEGGAINGGVLGDKGENLLKNPDIAARLGHTFKSNEVLKVENYNEDGELEGTAYVRIADHGYYPPRILDVQEGTAKQLGLNSGEGVEKMRITSYGVASSPQEAQAMVNALKSGQGSALALDSNIQGRFSTPPLPIRRDEPLIASAPVTVPDATGSLPPAIAAPRVVTRSIGTQGSSGELDTNIEGRFASPPPPIQRPSSPTAVADAKSPFSINVPDRLAGLTRTTGAVPSRDPQDTAPTPSISTAQQEAHIRATAAFVESQQKATSLANDVIEYNLAVQSPTADARRLMDRHDQLNARIAEYETQYKQNPFVESKIAVIQDGIAGAGESHANALRNIIIADAKMYHQRNVLSEDASTRSRTNEIDGYRTVLGEEITKLSTNADPQTVARSTVEIGRLEAEINKKWSGEELAVVNSEIRNEGWCLWGWCEAKGVLQARQAALEESIAVSDAVVQEQNAVQTLLDHPVYGDKVASLVAEGGASPEVRLAAVRQSEINAEFVRQKEVVNELERLSQLEAYQSGEAKVVLEREYNQISRSLAAKEETIRKILNGEELDSATQESLDALRGTCASCKIGDALEIGRFDPFALPIPGVKSLQGNSYTRTVGNTVAAGTNFVTGVANSARSLFAPTTEDVVLAAGMAPGTRFVNRTVLPALDATAIASIPVGLTRAAVRGGARSAVSEVSVAELAVKQADGSIDNGAVFALDDTMLVRAPTPTASGAIDEIVEPTLLPGAPVARTIPVTQLVDEVPVSQARPISSVSRPPIARPVVDATPVQVPVNAVRPSIVSGASPTLIQRLTGGVDPVVNTISDTARKITNFSSEIALQATNVIRGRFIPESSAPVTSPLSMTGKALSGDAAVPQAVVPTFANVGARARSFIDDNFRGARVAPKTLDDTPIVPANVAPKAADNDLRQILARVDNHVDDPIVVTPTPLESRVLPTPPKPVFADDIMRVIEDNAARVAPTIGAPAARGAPITARVFTPDEQIRLLEGVQRRIAADDSLALSLRDAADDALTKRLVELDEAAAKPSILSATPVQAPTVVNRTLRQRLEDLILGPAPKVTAPTQAPLDAKALAPTTRLVDDVPLTSPANSVDNFVDDAAVSPVPVNAADDIADDVARIEPTPTPVERPRSLPPTTAPRANVVDDAAGGVEQTVPAPAVAAVAPRSFVTQSIDGVKAATAGVRNLFARETPPPAATAPTIRPRSLPPDVAPAPAPSNIPKIGDVIQRQVSQADGIAAYQARNPRTQPASQTSLLGRSAAWTAKKCLQRKIWVVCSAVAAYAGYAGYGNLSDLASYFESPPATQSPQSSQANAGSGGVDGPPGAGTDDAGRDDPSERGGIPGDVPGTGTSDDRGVTSGDLDSTSAGSGSGFDLGAFSSIFSQLMKYFTQSAQEKEKEEAEKRAAAEREARERKLVAALIADPKVVEKNATTTLLWSSSGISAGAQVCSIIDAEFKTLRRGNKSGQMSSPKIASSTRFGVICHTGGTKALGETLVRVKGDTTVPPRLFSVHSASNYSIDDGEVSGSTGGSTSGGAGVSGGGAGGGGASGGESGNPAPEDIRTCDPELPMDEFIHCLCTVEPNPKGCAIPPGGLPDPRL